MGNARDTEVWTQRDGLSIDCEQLVILIQKEEDWPALDSELDEIQAVSKEFSELSIAYIPRSLKFRTNSLAKGVRSRASRLAFVNPFAPSWLAPQASMRAGDVDLDLISGAMNGGYPTSYDCSFDAVMPPQKTN
ncbi:hypothetical protein DY000_02016379 [Brassica cretica]|uniref:RNase H type-1 domain-containing protein n=1 Tax=Brassica cretica TaxID=69181 RepID=A0ABQ7CYK8_BRACR|nr:hypothetical protein DY000_02016379 [Brassica cretica]